MLKTPELLVLGLPNAALRLRLLSLADLTLWRLLRLLSTLLAIELSRSRLRQWDCALWRLAELSPLRSKVGCSIDGTVGDLVRGLGCNPRHNVVVVEAAVLSGFASEELNVDVCVANGIEGTELVCEWGVHEFDRIIIASGVGTDIA